MFDSIMVHQAFKSLHCGFLFCHSLVSCNSADSNPVRGANDKIFYAFAVIVFYTFAVNLLFPTSALITGLFGAFH